MLILSLGIQYHWELPLAPRYYQHCIIFVKSSALGYHTRSYSSSDGKEYQTLLFQLMSALLNMQNTVRSAIGVPPTVAGAQGLAPEMNVSNLIINPSKS